MKQLYFIFIFLLLPVACKNMKSGEERTEKPFEATWESLSSAQPADWWDEGKFGIFIHWGPYSVAGYRYENKGYAEAITNDMYRRPELYRDFFLEKFGGAPPEFGYKDWIRFFTAEKWNPDSWARLFREAGAKYVIPTGEHHDGFVLWDSDLTDWCATKMGPKRDLIGDLAAAVRKEGLNFGVSYHRERHPSRFTEGFKIKDEPFHLVAEEIKLVPECASLYGPFEYSDQFINDYKARWKEVQDKYHPDFLWMDDVPIFYHAPEDDPQVNKYLDAFKEMIAGYLNAAQQWGKEVYFNNKGKIPNFPDGVGCREKDNMQVDTIGPRWQNPATMGVSYAYMKYEDDNDLYKTPAELIRLLADVVSKNGNLLLNIGPRADGTIPEGMKSRLLEMGKWLKKNGASIYGTRPWHTYGEYRGDIIEEAEVHYSKHSMRIHEEEYRFTTKPDCIYIIAFQAPQDDVLLETFRDEEMDMIKSVTTIEGEKIPWEKTENGLMLHPDSMEPELAYVYLVHLRHRAKSGN